MHYHFVNVNWYERCQFCSFTYKLAASSKGHFVFDRPVMDDMLVLVSCFRWKIRLFSQVPWHTMMIMGFVLGALLLILLGKRFTWEDILPFFFKTCSILPMASFATRHAAHVQVVHVT